MQHWIICFIKLVVRLKLLLIIDQLLFIFLRRKKYFGRFQSDWLLLGSNRCRQGSLKVALRSLDHSSKRCCPNLCGCVLHLERVVVLLNCYFGGRGNSIIQGMHVSRIMWESSFPRVIKEGGRCSPKFSISQFDGGICQSYYSSTAASGPPPWVGGLEEAWVLRLGSLGTHLQLVCRHANISDEGLLLWITPPLWKGATDTWCCNYNQMYFLFLSVHLKFAQ